jgi:hypothetical protein
LTVDGVNLMIYQHRNNCTCKDEGDKKAKNPGYDKRKFRRIERLTCIPKQVKTDKSFWICTEIKPTKHSDKSHEDNDFGHLINITKNLIF